MCINGVLIAVIALASSAAFADVRHEFIPESLRGSWGAGSDGCGAGDESIIALSANAYERAGERCTVEWVSETAGPTGPIYSAYSRCQSQPAGQRAAANLIMRPEDVNRIAIGPDFENLKVYRKCPVRQ